MMKRAILAAGLTALCSVAALAQEPTEQQWREVALLLAEAQVTIAEQGAAATLTAPLVRDVVRLLRGRL